MPQRTLDPIQQVVDVSYRYPVAFTSDLFSPENPLLAQTCQPSVPGRAPRILVVVDEGVSDAFPDLLDRIETYFGAFGSTLDLVRSPIIVPGGEQVKNNHRHVDLIREAVNEFGIDRHSYVVVVGGGAVLDMAGYAAATAHRGIRLIRVPTTVLSQNDSGVGVKNSVNEFVKK